MTLGQDNRYYGATYHELYQTINESLALVLKVKFFCQTGSQLHNKHAAHNLTRLQRVTAVMLHVQYRVLLSRCSSTRLQDSVCHTAPYACNSPHVPDILVRRRLTSLRTRLYTPAGAHLQLSSSYDEETRHLNKLLDL